MLVSERLKQSRSFKPSGMIPCGRRTSKAGKVDHRKHDFTTVQRKGIEHIVSVSFTLFILYTSIAVCPSHRGFLLCRSPRGAQ